MPKRNIIWTLAIVAAGVVTVLVTRPAPPPEKHPVPPVARAYQKIRDGWYFPPDGTALQQAAVRGMVGQLDEFSSYVAPDRIARFHARLDGRATCVGLLVERLADGVEIIGALPGSPAHQAGIGPGGRLISVDERRVADLSAEGLRELLEGPGAGKVHLAVVDPAGRTQSYDLTRKTFRLETVTGVRRKRKGQWDCLLDPATGIACVRVKEFVHTTVEHLRQALRELGGPHGIVLDLRDNPGGRIEVGYAVANLFLRKGVIFTRVDRAGRRRPFPARSAGTHRPVPMVVLINERTASAAEMVAGALRLHDRAVLVGTRTCGKGLVQSMISLPGGLGQINLTTAEFLVGTSQRIRRSPEGDTGGVEPHRRIDLTAAEDKARRRFWADTEVMPGPQPTATTPATAPTTAPATRPADRALRADRQLAEAARLLAADGEIRALLDEARAERLRRQEQSTRRASSRPSQDANGAEGAGRE